MLVSANHSRTLMTPLPKQPGEDPVAEAAAGLQSATLQALQNNVQAQTAQAGAKVDASASKITTQPVSEASRVSDNVDEAFAKTRVGLQMVNSKLPTDILDRIKGGATNEFKEYMSKTPEQRLQEAILEEMGLTKEEVEKMPPEQQQAVAEEIAERMQDKIKLAEAEKDSSRTGVADKVLAALV